MTLIEMAQIHAAAFSGSRGWSVPEFEALLAQPHTALFAAADGFALTRTLADESELLTLAVAPAEQRRGIARGLITQWISAAKGIADTAFLDVAADNHAALALYDSTGFHRSGLRKAYYARATGPAADAVLMSRALTRG